MSNDKLAKDILDNLFDNDDFEELEKCGFATQAHGFKISMLATIGAILDSNSDKLTEQNKLLREALVLADSWLKIDPEYHASPVCETVIKALEATKC